MIKKHEKEFIHIRKKTIPKILFVLFYDFIVLCLITAVMTNPLMELPVLNPFWVIPAGLTTVVMFFSMIVFPIWYLNRD